MAATFRTVLVLLSIGAGVVSCSLKTTPAASASSKNKTADQTSEELGRNNLVTISREGVYSNGSGTLKMEGSNNLIDFVSENAAYLSNRDVVIIVQGNNNIIKLYNRNLVDLSGPGADTLLFVGENNRFVVSTSNVLILKKQPVTTDTIAMRSEPVSASTYQPDLEYTAEELKALEAGLNAGDPETYFDLGKKYQFEIEKPEAVLKAIALYEFAAARNHLQAIRNLGDIYANGSFDLKPNLQKARYYFTLGAGQQDEYSQQRLEELRKR